MQEVAGNNLYASAENLVLSGPVGVEAGKKLHLQALKKIEISAGASIAKNVSLGIKEDFFNLAPFAPATPAQVSSFCNSPEYRAHLLLPGTAARLAVEAAVEDSLEGLQIQESPQEPIGERSQHLLTLAVEPNPNQGYFQLSVSQQGAYWLSIADIHGKEVHRQRVLQEGLSPVYVEVESLPSGLYMLSVEGQAGTARQRVVKY
ncbi:MAG: T9SS type A sorting domain-containing protein [Cytophagales bacterium]|nr:T9SS type A sorting domain-containing protein [Cytophagales bacterium]